jgi:hypothetical protein
MAQTFTEDSFAAAHVGLTDLQNMENNFIALKTLFSGSSAPANSTGGMPWFDTGKKILKIRNSTNGAWLGVHYSSTAARWWVYANTAGDGWIVDSSVSDRVLAIKGGANAYNAAGGSAAGSWTISGTTLSVNSTGHTHLVGVHTHAYSVIDVASTISEGTNISVVQSVGNSTGFNTGGVSTSHRHTFSNDATWRPAASIGTLQYLDM